MKLIPNGVVATALILVSACWPVTVQADTTSDPSLVISQLKITSSSGQFVTLYNSSNGTLNMSNYQLEYFNNFDLTKATSSKLIALSGTLPPHGYFMVNDGDLLLCYQLTVDSVSLGLSSTAGLVEVLAFSQASPGGSVSPTLEDYVGWSKVATPGAQTLPTGQNALLQRQPVDSQGNPNVAIAGAGSWQAVEPSANNACTLLSAITSFPVTTGLNQLLPGSEPPANIVSLATTSIASTTPQLPAADVGLMAPEITEILPNPVGSGNDATDEFIELYNPNAQSFDLSGFGLQSGLTSLHHFTFAAGIKLPAKAFTAFYSSSTRLSLSNTSGQVKLFDPLGNSISATQAYGVAKDGQAWALAKGKWYWTTSPTPNKANVIKQVSVTKTTKPSAKKVSAPAVKGAQTTAANTSGDTSQSTVSVTSLTPIHNWVLAVAAALALLYGAYEYRQDLANRFVQFRGHRKARRANRPTS